MRANYGRTYQKTASVITNAAEDPIPPLADYQAFSASFLAQNPRTSPKSPMRDPTLLRRIASGFRGRGPAHLAEAYGKSTTWVLKIISQLPPHLK